MFPRREEIRVSRLRRTALSIASLSLVACGGDDTPSAVADFATRVIATFCERGVRCGDYADRASCVESNRADYSQLIIDVNAGKTHYDPAAGTACLLGIGAVPGLGSCILTEQLGASPPQACRDAVRGTIADGEPCVTSEQCISKTCNKGACEFPGICCVGVCNPTVNNPVPVGGACGAPGSYCVAEALCQNEPAGLTCVAKANADEACALLGGCVAGLACVPTDSEPVCGHVPVEGEPCDSVVPGCDLAVDFCDPATGACQPRIRVGHSCPRGVGCVNYAYCHSMTLTCVARGGRGDPCVGSVGTCLGDLVCIEDRCDFPPLPTTCQ